MGVRNALTIIGTVIGAYFGNPQLGFMIGSAVGGYVDPVKIDGPRLTDAKVQTARAGVPIAWGFGRFRTAGTMIYCQPGAPTQHSHESSGKGSGPVQTTYTYTRTHAILVCEGPVIGIRRIWRDQKLVYDASMDASSDGIAGSVAFAQRLTIYLGDETQLPDPELEAIFGAGNVPAHRGYCYVVFKDDDVTDRGGSVSNYEFEVVKAGTANPYEPVQAGLIGWWKLNDSATGIALDSSGNEYHGVYGGNYSAASAVMPGSYGSTRFNDRTGYVTIPFATHAGGLNVGGTGEWSIEASIHLDSGTAGSVLRCICVNWGSAVNGYQDCGLTLDSTNELLPRAATTKSSTSTVSATGPDQLTTSEPYHLLATKGADGIHIYVNNVLVGSNTSADAISVPLDVFDGGDDGSGIGIGGYAYPNSYGWPGKIENVAIYDAALNEAQRYALYTTRLLAGQPVPDAPGWVIGSDGQYYGTAQSIDLIDPQPLSLADIVSAICLRCGLAADQIDPDELDDIEVDGYFIARETNGDACLAPLMQAFFFDQCNQDEVLYYRRRGGDPVVALTADDLVAKENGPPIERMREQEVERPRKVHVNYYDPEQQYIPTKQTAQRLAATISAVGERSIELPVTMSGDKAAQVADVAIKVTWTDLLGQLLFDLPAQFSYLVPSDVVTLPTDLGKVERLRIDGIDNDGGVLHITARQDRKSAYDSNATGIGDPGTPVGPSPVGPTILEYLDCRPLRDADDKVGFYIAVCGRSAGWYGAQIQMSRDGGETFTPVFESVQPAIIGVTTTDLLAAPAEVFMDSQTVTVELYGSQELSSVTMQQILDEANGIAINNELLQFKTATFVSGTTWTLTGLSHGRLGSIPDDHDAGSRFVVLAGAVFIECERELIGQEITLRAVGYGTTEDSNPSETFTFECLAQTEHAPSFLQIERDGSDNVSVAWTGRGRLGSAQYPSHGVYFTGYRLEFEDGSTVITKNTTDQFYAYSAAEQTTDFGTPPASLTVRVYQINSITGAGDPVEGTV